MAIVYGFGLHAPLFPALALFGAGWLASFVLAQAGFPLLRLGYAEDGGELGRIGLVAAVRSSSVRGIGRDLRRRAFRRSSISAPVSTGDRS